MSTTYVGGRVWHRPVRTWPVRVPSAPIRVAPPPTPPTDPSGNTWQLLLPLVGSLSIVAFAFVARSLAYLLVAAVLVVMMVAASVGMRVSQRRTATRRWSQTRESYLATLRRAEQESLRAAAIFRDAERGLHPDPRALLDVVRGGAAFERRPADEDFGRIRLGCAAVPAPRPVIGEDGGLGTGGPGTGGPGTGGPGSGGADADLARLREEVIARTALVTDAPAVVSLTDAPVIGVVGDRATARSTVIGWVAELVALHAPTDLRLMGLIPPEAEQQWEWTKWLPHTRDPLAGEGFGRVRRTITADRPRFLAALEALLAGRRETRADDSGRRTPRRAGEHVVVVVDGWDPATMADSALGKAIDDAAALGMSIILLGEHRTDLPASTSGWLDLTGGAPAFHSGGPHGTTIAPIALDRHDPQSLEELARNLAPLRLVGADARADHVDMVRLVDLLGLEHAGEHEPDEQWLRLADLSGTHAELLTAPIGTAAEGQPLVLDLKEAAAGGLGPHGVLVGATGSGKSELLRTLTTALAARHHPELLALTLIDFKGGAAFAGLQDLPHVAGVITNLADDLSLIDRVRAALIGEIHRRQELLRAAGNLESISAYHQAAATRSLPNLPYLLIVVDEFGELLAANPEFLDVFIQIGRLGRSLGVHLLLATQRLDEGRIRGLEPHLRYRIALRTYTAAESQAVLGNADAFELPPLPGLGYLKADTTQIRFKAALVTTPHRPPRQVHTFQLAGSDLIRPFHLVEPPEAEATEQRTGSDDQTDLDVLVDRMRRDTAGRTHQVWLDPLPTGLSLGELLAALPEPVRIMQVPFGLLDLPERQSQQPHLLDLRAGGGNVAVVGGPRTGKTTALIGLLAGLACVHTVDQCQLYCLDLTGGGLHALSDLPHVGAVVGRDQPETIARIVRELRAVVEERAAQMRELQVADLAELRRRVGPADPLPDIVLAVDGMALLRAHYADIEAEIGELAATGLHYGVHVAVTAARWLDIRPAILDAFGTRIELRLNDPVESQVNKHAAMALPVDTPGRALTRDGQQVQIALPSLLPTTGAQSAHDLLGQLVTAVRDQEGDRRAPRITPLPALLAESALPSTPPGTLRLGLQEYRSAPVALDLLARGRSILVAGDHRSGRTTLLGRIIAELGRRDDVVVHLVDPLRTLIDHADAPQVADYSFAPTDVADLSTLLAKQLDERLPPAGLTVAQLRTGGWWAGPQHVLVVDDYELLVPTNGGLSPLTPLLDAVTYGADIGFHVVLARSVVGLQRHSYEPFTQRLRDTADTAIVLSGPPQEGTVYGDVAARPQPPGRGLLVHRAHRPVTVQLAVPEDVR